MPDMMRATSDDVSLGVAMSATLLTVGPTGRYLVDAAGAPVFLNGDTAWSMIVSVTPDRYPTYLEDRAARGFNAVIINAIEAVFTADPPRTVDGLEPFHDGGSLTSPNEDYWGRVDLAIDLAGGLGIHVLLAPLYLGYASPAFPGYGGRDEGWHGTVARTSEEGCRAYGSWLGRRYRDRDNLVWVIGGDRNPGDVLGRMRAFVDGIRHEDDRHLITAHVHPDDSPVEQYAGDSWLTLNQTYSYRIVHKRLLEDFARVPVRPFVLFESTYEGEHEASDLQVRRQAWWALTCGATGQFFGNYPVWLMSPGWEVALGSPGAQAMSRLGELTRTVAWWKLVPDDGHRFLVAGLSEENGLDRATAALADDGTLAVTYVPTPRHVTIDPTVMSGWAVRYRWFDPVTGAWSEPRMLTRTGMSHGMVTIETPSDHDSVLVVDDPSDGAHGVWGRPTA